MMNALEREWEIIHRDHERYEQFALVIKLITLLVVLACWVFAVDAVLTIIFIAVLWLQEGIWKTYQARLGARLLWIEQSLRTPGSKDGAPYQLYSTWSAQPKNLMAMLMEYLTNAIRPTVAYPYVVLVALAMGVTVFGNTPV